MLELLHVVSEVMFDSTLMVPAAALPESREAITTKLKSLFRFFKIGWFMLVAKCRVCGLWSFLNA